MKVLLVNKYHYIKGGSETYYFGLSELLESKGHQVIYFAMADEQNYPCEQQDYFVSNVDFNGKISLWQKLKAGFRVIYSFEAKKKITALIEKEKPDVVHINLVHRHLTLSIVRAIKKFNIPVVFTLHDVNCICPNHTMLSENKVCEDCLKGNCTSCIKKKCVKNSTAKSLLSAVEALNYKRMRVYDDVDLYICPSDFYRKKHQESGITKSKIIHKKNFLPLGTEFSCETKHEDYFLYFGRLSQEKGIMTLIKAFEKSESKSPLYILGTGDMEDEIKLYIKNHKLENRVKLFGFKTGEELKSFVKKAKCIVLPSEWYENGPYAIMEAMSVGKPVIVSNIGGLPEIVQHKVTGFIFEPWSVEQLSACIDEVNSLSFEEYEKMSEKATATAKELFDADRYYTELMACYKECIQKKTH